jgi:hypothetical protein
LYLTLAWITLDILPAQALSVPCEWIFSGSKQIMTDHHSHVGPTIFEELIIMKSAWGPNLYDMVVWNAADHEHINNFNFEEFLTNDVDSATWDQEAAAAYSWDE